MNQVEVEKVQSPVVQRLLQSDGDVFLRTPGRLQPPVVFQEASGRGAYLGVESVPELGDDVDVLTLDHTVRDGLLESLSALLENGEPKSTRAQTAPRGETAVPSRCRSLRLRQGDGSQPSTRCRRLPRPQLWGPVGH